MKVRHGIWELYTETCMTEYVAAVGIVWDSRVLVVWVFRGYQGCINVFHSWIKMYQSPKIMVLKTWPAHFVDLCDLSSWLCLKRVPKKHEKTHNNLQNPCIHSNRKLQRIPDVSRPCHGSSYVCCLPGRGALKLLKMAILWSIVHPSQKWPKRSQRKLNEEKMAVSTFSAELWRFPKGFWETQRFSKVS
jgi:hypothetical protein